MLHKLHYFVTRLSESSKPLVFNLVPFPSRLLFLTFTNNVLTSKSVQQIYVHAAYWSLPHSNSLLSREEAVKLLIFIDLKHALSSKHIIFICSANKNVISPAIDGLLNKPEGPDL